MWYHWCKFYLFLILIKFSICILNFLIFFFLRLVLFLGGIYFLFFDLVYFIEWEILRVHSCLIVITFLFDWIRLLFISFVLFISSLVIFYRKDYINEEVFINRFILLVIIFVLSMILLIISPNLIRILLGWDGLGLVSYCLVIYYQNIKSFNSGILTALRNRIGDVALLIAIAWILNYGRWNFIFYIEIIKFDLQILVIGVLVILAAITKRAQIPFSAWLPAAMAAPTPVSALVHSSTLVTAGVYLLIRFNILFFDTYLGGILLLFRGLTIFIAGLAANFEFDLKKIIALSTLRQLGLMIRILSIGFSKLAFFHLLTHALFKALLFICAGAIIHNIKNSQDIRDIGSLLNFIPFSLICFNIANLALCGLPFLAGFYSKDLILEIVLISQVNIFSFFLFFFSTGLTVCYSLRLMYYTIFGKFNLRALNNLRDERFFIFFRIGGLLIIAIIGGSLLRWIIFSSNYFIMLPWHLKNLILFVCIIGGIIGYLISQTSLIFFNKSLYTYFISFLNSSMWFLPIISTLGIIIFPIKIGLKSFKLFDQGWLEHMGSQHLFSFLIKFSIINQRVQNNSLKIYFMIFVFWIIIFILIILLSL